MRERTLLIVDDEQEIIRSIAEQIKAKMPHFRIVNAGNGEMGIEVASKTQPDLILMDWEMPEMDGIEAIRKLKNQATTHEIPVIMATGRMTTSEDLQIALDSGAVDYMRKPIDFVELTARMNTALRIAEQRESIKELLQSEIDLKNRKLSATSMLIVEKNGLMQEFQRSMEELQIYVPGEAEEAINLLKVLQKRISTHLDLDDSWETFKIHFEEVHPKFFEELHSRTKDLSHKDLKLCAYVKLGMDNKQIARLLNISPGSARTALSRLKKKLNIDQEVDLREAIVEW